MKVAIPTRGNVVDDHFGHCEAYTVFTVNENKKIEKAEILPSPQGCGCKSNIGAILQQIGVKVMLAGNMGDGALNVLNSYGIEVYRGCSGNVMQVAEAFLQGKIDDSGEGCHHHEEQGEGHQCNH
ncbi:MAG: NifB/NifX family molybdenum-iron cluster-binding protein [Lentimicrobiaceae bacterium]